MDVDSEPSMEETILVGDDLMTGPPSPIIPPEIASHVLEGVETCDGILRNFFLCLQINDIEPFCQDEIVIYKQCVDKRVGSYAFCFKYLIISFVEVFSFHIKVKILKTGFVLVCGFMLQDEILRQRLRESEHKLGLSMPLDDAKDRATQLQSEVTSLERRLILASGAEGMDGFRQRWSLHGRLEDTKKRLESLKQGMEKREKKEEPTSSTTSKKGWFS
ncbi:hypothetical protein MKW92_053882 [Papaver armeniacum]|nr:hypothetical protein MKW92_053882 [Papaver armeniacum]